MNSFSEEESNLSFSEEESNLSFSEEESNLVVPTAQVVGEKSVVSQESNRSLTSLRSKTSAASCIEKIKNVIKSTDESLSCAKGLLCSTMPAKESTIKVIGNHHMLREIDLNGDGEITFDEVLAFAKKFEKEEKKGKFYKTTALALMVALIVLTASNVGTAMLAIAITKQIKVADDGTLETVAGSKAVKTESKAFTTVLLPDRNGNGARRLEDWEMEHFDTGGRRAFKGCVGLKQIANTLLPGSKLSSVVVDMEGGTTKSFYDPYEMVVPPDFEEMAFDPNVGGELYQIKDNYNDISLIAPNTTNPNDLCAHLNNEMNGFDFLPKEEDTEGFDEFRRSLEAIPEFRRRLQTRGRYTIYAAYQNAYNKFTAFFG